MTAKPGSTGLSFQVLERLEPGGSQAGLRRLVTRPNQTKNEHAKHSCMKTLGVSNESKPRWDPNSCPVKSWPVGMTPLPVCCLRLCGTVQWATPAGTEGGMEVSGRAWTGAETPSQPFISVVLKARRLLPECRLLTDSHMYLQPFLVMYIFGSDVSVMEPLHFWLI